MVTGALILVTRALVLLVPLILSFRVFSSSACATSSSALSTKKAFSARSALVLLVILNGVLVPLLGVLMSAPMTILMSTPAAVMLHL